MHVMGKVGVWLVVIAAAASTVLTAKLIQVRNSFTRKANAYQAAWLTSQDNIAKTSEQLARLEADYFRAKELWGQYWKDVQTTVQRPAEGILAIGIGQNHGIRKGQYLYAFEVQQDGSSIYRGDFTVENLADVQAQMKPNWVVRAEDVENWKPGNWRWRNMIPPGNQPVFDEQGAAILRADDVLAERNKKRAAEIVLEKKAQEQNDLREAELLGGDRLSKDPAVDVEYREGLVAAVEQIEEERNQVLRKVDDLRRRLRAAQLDVDRRTKENIELSRKLPQPAPVVGSTTR